MKARRKLIFINDTTICFGDGAVMQKLMVEAEQLLQNARMCFMLAAKALTQADIERHAAIGRDYLELAHEAARIDVRR